MEHHELQVGDATVHILGSVPGFAPDGAAVRAFLEEHAADTVALGVPPEDLPALQTLSEAEDPASLIPSKAEGPDLTGGAPGLEGIHGVGIPEERGAVEDEGFAALDPIQQRLLTLLERFGEVVLPSPDLQESFRWAASHDRTVEPLDLDDDAHAEVFVRANRLWDIIRSGRLRTRLLQADFADAKDPADLVRQFDAMQNRQPSLRAVEDAREQHMAARIREVAAGTTVAVVPLARLQGVLDHLDLKVHEP